MSFSKVSTIVAAFAATFALSTVAYGDPGKSPNGPPGPAGNPNQEQAQSQAAPPASPGQSDESHGKSDQAQQNSAKPKSHPKAKAPKQHSAPAKPQQKQNHANPNKGTPRKGGREDRPAGKITICHATKSVTNPYVEITISVNGLHGHGPAEDPHHHAGSWKDIIPAPAGGCPSAVTPEQGGTQNNEEKDHGKVTICHATGSATNPFVVITIAQEGWDNGHSKHEDDINPAPEGGCPGTTPTTTTTPEQPNPFVAPVPEVAVTAPAATTETAPAAGEQGVLGVRAQGGTAPASETAPANGNEVLGAEASGGNAPAAAVAPAAAEATKDADTGSLPFTGFELALMLVLAAAALMAGFALKRASRQDG